ncbi:MAG: ATP synthase F1 subunit delta [Flavobacteriales bacterium]
MRSTKAAIRYAQSLLELAIEQKSLDQVKADMALIAQCVAESHEVDLMLQSPIIKPDLKKKTLEKVFGSSISKLSQSFVALLTTKGRESILPQIAVSFIGLYNEHMGIVSAEVVTATKLTAAQRDELKKTLSSTGKTIELIERVDPRVMGGVRIKVGDQLMDATVRRKLNELKVDIANNKLSASN